MSPPLRQLAIHPGGEQAIIFPSRVSKSKHFSMIRAARIRTTTTGTDPPRGRSRGGGVTVRSITAFVAGVFRILLLGPYLFRNQLRQQFSELLYPCVEFSRVRQICIDSVGHIVPAVVRTRAVVGSRFLGHVVIPVCHKNTGGVPGSQIGPSRHAAGRVRVDRR
jgi:hypothetical protein